MKALVFPFVAAVLMSFSAAVVAGCGGNSCEELNELLLSKFEECSIPVDESNDGNCSKAYPADADQEQLDAIDAYFDCLLPCYEAASCETITNIDDASDEEKASFAACLTPCQN